MYIESHSGLIEEYRNEVDKLRTISRNSIRAESLPSGNLSTKGTGNARNLSNIFRMASSSEQGTVFYQ